MLSANDARSRTEAGRVNQLTRFFSCVEEEIKRVAAEGAFATEVCVIGRTEGEVVALLKVLTSSDYVVTLHEDKQYVTINWA